MQCEGLHVTKNDDFHVENNAAVPFFFFYLPFPHFSKGFFFFLTLSSPRPGTCPSVGGDLLRVLLEQQELRVLRP